MSGEHSGVLVHPVQSTPTHTNDHPAEPELIPSFEESMDMEEMVKHDFKDVNSNQI